MLTLAGDLPAARTLQNEAVACGDADESGAAPLMPLPPPRRPTQGDRVALAGALASAFRDNPLNRAVIGGSPRQRLRANRSGMRATLAAADPICSVWVTDGETGRPVGGLIAMGPGVWPLPPPPILEQIRVLLGQGLRTANRWGEVFECLRLLHPVEDHWYLALVGVEPGAQGAGRGRDLLRSWLQEVDADGMPAYLETDQPDLLGLYGAFGFLPVDRLDVLGVPVWRLWREARP